MGRIANIRKACRITDKIMADVLKNFSKFKTEKEVYSFILRQIRKNKCKKAFPPVIGYNSYKPHQKPRKTRLKKGFCFIDFGVKYKGYCSDMTRTIYIGKPSKKETAIYSLVLKAQKKAINAVKEGVECRKIDSIARNSFGKRKKYFIHATGHAIGRKVHQKPSLHPKTKTKLKANKVITVEPGLYIKEKKIGIRIEDCVLVKKRGCEILTKTPKKLRIII